MLIIVGGGGNFRQTGGGGQRPGEGPTRWGEVRGGSVCGHEAQARILDIRRQEAHHLRRKVVNDCHGVRSMLGDGASEGDTHG